MAREWRAEGPKYRLLSVHQIRGIRASSLVIGSLKMRAIGLTCPRRYVSCPHTVPETAAYTRLQITKVVLMSFSQDLTTLNPDRARHSLKTYPKTCASSLCGALNLD